MEINRLSALRTRAYENMVAVATCNYPEGHPDCNGHSTLLFCPDSKITLLILPQDTFIYLSAGVIIVLIRSETDDPNLIRV